MVLFSLVVSTMGRSEELRPLLASLQGQTFDDFEVLLVDQNDDNRLLALLNEDWRFPLRRIACPGERCLRRGRYGGCRLARGTFMCFPDDDCWYMPDFLCFAAERLSSLGADFLTGRAANERGNDVNGRYATSAQMVRHSNVWITQIEWVAFFRRSLLEAIGGYDVEIGVGASTPWQSGEGQDLVLRALATGAAGWFDPKLVGRHAEFIVDNPPPAIVEKGRIYGRGMGHVLRKHRFGLAAGAYWISRPLARAAYSACRLKLREARYYMQVATGRLEGALGRMLPIP